MSYSWAFVGDFDLPPARAAAFRRKHPPAAGRRRATSLGGPSFVYEGDRLRHYRLCDKSEWADLVAAVRALCAELAAIGAKGDGAVVGFLDGAPDDRGLRIRIANDEVSETPIETKAAVRTVHRSAAFGALVRSLEESTAAATAPPTKSRASADGIRAEVLDHLDRVSDAELLAAARATDLRVDVPAKGRTRWVHLAERYPKADALRAALRRGDPSFKEADVNRAPFEVFAAVDPRAAVTLARRVVDAKVDAADPTVGGAVRALAVSKDDADLERILRSFQQNAGVFGGSDALRRSLHPGVDERLFAELTELIGEPGAWKAPVGKNDLVLAIAQVLDQRGYPKARPFLAAAKLRRSSPYWFLFKHIKAKP